MILADNYYLYVPKCIYLCSSSSVERLGSVDVSDFFHFFTLRFFKGIKFFKKKLRKGRNLKKKYVAKKGTTFLYQTNYGYFRISSFFKIFMITKKVFYLFIFFSFSSMYPFTGNKCFFPLVVQGV